jgi:hypothetical protein
MAVRHAITSFRKGLNLADPVDGGGNIPVPMFAGVGQGWKVYYEDFLGTLKEGVPTDSIPGWEITETNSTPTFANCGLLATLGGADNDTGTYQYANPSIAPLATAKDFYLETRFSVSGASAADVSLGAYFVGLTSDQQGANFATTLDAAWLFDDGIGFGGLTGRSEADAIVRVTDVEQTIGLGREPMVVGGAFHKYGLYYSADAAKYTVYYDDKEVANSSAEVVPDNANLGVTVYIAAGEGKANTINAQYVMAAFQL